MKHEVNKGVLEKKNKKINDKNKGNIKAFVFSQKLDSWTISDQSKMASAQLTLYQLMAPGDKTNAEVAV